MSVHTKRALLVVTALLALTIWRVMAGVQVTGSGGLGVVSVGFSEGMIDFLFLSAIVGAFFYWQHRRRVNRRRSRTERAS